jgi:nitric oxide reductase subunit B
MPISSWWFQGALLTYLVGFTVLGILAHLVYRDQSLLPTKVAVAEKILFTRDDIMSGVNVFQRYGLMEYGSVYGHGAYLGPDFTAEYLHKTAEFLVKTVSGGYARRTVRTRAGRSRATREQLRRRGRQNYVGRSAGRGAPDNRKLLSVRISVVF